MATRLFYTAKDGTKYPLREAAHDMAFRLFKNLRTKSIMGDPEECWLSKSLCKNSGVKGSHIGSGGDAYVIFKETEDDPVHAKHFKVRPPTLRKIDGFDKNRGRGMKTTETIILHKPPPSWKIAARQEMNARRRAEIAAGAPVRHRGRPRRTRVMRMGSAPRPRAHISRIGGNVDMGIDE
jgi:hypothetical protein